SRDRDERRKPSAVIADARTCKYGSVPLHAHARAFGKNGVEMRRNDDMWSRGDAGSRPKDVPRLVDANVQKAEMLELQLERVGATLFLERRRGNLAEADLIVDDGGIRPDGVERGSDFACFRQRGKRVRAVQSDGARSSETHREPEAGNRARDHAEC